MTQLLERAWAEVQKLSAPEQDAIATLILEELEDEERWDKSFRGSQAQLSRLAEKVRADIQSGRVKAVEIDAL